MNTITLEKFTSLKGADKTDALSKLLKGELKFDNSGDEVKDFFDGLGRKS